MKFYAVFDTNVLVSSLLTKNPNSATTRVIKAISNKQLIPLYSQEILKEYEDVLHRAKFSFNKSVVNNLIALIMRDGFKVSPNSLEEQLPDMDDVIFYEVVMERRERGDDAYLITGNMRHFPEKHFIVTPAEMMEIIEKTNNQK